MLCEQASLSQLWLHLILLFLSVADLAFPQSIQTVLDQYVVNISSTEVGHMLVVDNLQTYCVLFYDTDAERFAAKVNRHDFNVRSLSSIERKSTGDSHWLFNLKYKVKASFSAGPLHQKLMIFVEERWYSNDCACDWLPSVLLCLLFKLFANCRVVRARWIIFFFASDHHCCVFIRSLLVGV